MEQSWPQDKCCIGASRRSFCLRGMLHNPIWLTVTYVFQSKLNLWLLSAHISLVQVSNAKKQPFSAVFFRFLLSSMWNKCPTSSLSVLLNNGNMLDCQYVDPHLILGLYMNVWGIFPLIEQVHIYMLVWALVFSK